MSSYVPPVDADESIHPGKVTANADLDALLTHTALKVAQGTSMVVVPAYLVSRLIRRRPFSIRGMMRHAWMWPAALGAVSVGPAYLRLKDEPDYALSDRLFRLQHSASQRRCDDYSMIGAGLGALLVPTLLLKRAPLISLVVGGASIGLGGGVIAHMIREAEDGEAVLPKGKVAGADVGKVTRQL